MPATSAVTATPRTHLFAWRIVAWLLLLLAAFGIFQYCVHGWHLVAGLRATTGEDARAAAIRMLMWDVAYLAGACITVAAAAGALLGRGWARPVLRIVAALLALWLLVTAIVLARDWMHFSADATAALAKQGLLEAGRGLMAHARRSFYVAIALKIVAIPILAWLAWRLGVPSVRAQFRASPPRKAR